MRGMGSGGNGRGAGQPGRRARRYVLPLFASGLCAAAIAGILINALTLQKTRHPAPLFARAAPPAVVREPSITETRPAPRPSPNTANDKPAAEKSLIDQRPLEKASGVRPRAQAPAVEAAEPKPADPISQLLKTPAPAREEKLGAPAAPAAQGKTVLAAQRALVKLGFVLKPDGAMGATTRQALLRYERDRGLPAHGEFTPSLLRRLSSEAGIAIP